MKKKIGLLIVAIIAITGGTYMLWSAFFKYKDMEIDDILWTNSVNDKNKHIHTIYLYRDGKREKIGDILLDCISKKGENLLVGVQNLYPNADEFRGIVTYDISSKEVSEILARDKIDDFLGEGNHEFRGNIQMTKDGNFFYFVRGGKMISYDVENDKLEILFETSSRYYSLNEEETCLFFSNSPTLYRYNLSTKTIDTLLNGCIYSFAVSKDEKVIVYEEFKEKALFLYNMDTKEKEKLVDLNYGYGIVYISEDNRYILYTDYKEAFVPTNRKIRIYVLDLETGKRRIIYKGNYHENIGNVLW